MKLLSENLVKSAQMTADAWEEVIPILTTVECETCAGGALFHRRAHSNWRPNIQPVKVIAHVLPFTYFSAGASQGSHAP